MTLRVSVPDESWLADLADLDIELLVWDGDTDQPEGHLDLVLRRYDLDVSSLANIDTSRVTLVQGQALGFDGVADALPAGGVYANVVGVHEGSTAELAIALTLSSLRHVDDFARAMPEARWRKRWSTSLIDSTVMLLGVGGIGEELRQRLTGFGCELVRVGTSARDDEHGHVHGTDELADLLPTVDVVIVAVPLTDSTTRLVDAQFLAALHDDALVVNVARGLVVDTEAVLAEVGRLRFAADVFDPEPLPDDHPLWTSPGVLVSPHVGGMSSAMRPRVEAIVRDQIARLERGDDPAHVVVRT